MIILDAFLGYLKLVILKFPSEEEYFIERFDPRGYFDSVGLISDAFSAFTKIFFAAEMICVILSFQFQVLGHVGYTTDAVIVLLQFYLDTVGINRESRILNVFRLWRLYRLVTSLVNVEKALHAKTNERLEDALVEVSTLKMNNQNL